jgi:hypothetical protein
MSLPLTVYKSVLNSSVSASLKSPIALNIHQKIKKNSKDSKSVHIFSLVLVVVDFFAILLFFAK